MHVGLTLCAAVAAVGVLGTGVLAVSPNADELSEARKWAGAKFEGIQPAQTRQAGLIVLANHDPVTQNNREGKPLKIGDVEYTRGLYCHAVSKVVVQLPSPGKTFSAVVGVDSHSNGGSIEFSASVEGKELFKTGVMHSKEPGVPVKADLNGANEFILSVSDAGDGISSDQACWADAKVELANGETIWLGDMKQIDTQAQPYTTDAPFSFIYNGKPSSELLKTWKFSKSKKKLDDNRIQHTLTYTDPDTGLQVKCVGVEYNDYPTVEWTVYFKNTGSADTPILENIQGLDTKLYRSGTGEFLLHHNVGSPVTPNDYQPLETPLPPSATKRLAAVGGKSTQGDWSYFNVEYSGGGTIIVVGWSGQWAAQLTRDENNGLHVIAGQELTHMKLHPGEEVRTPLIVLQFWNGEWIRSQNIWRKWMLAYGTPKDDGKTIRPLVTAASSDQFAEMTKATAADQMLFVDRYLAEGLKLDYWWMDAGWYPCDGNWPQVGTWEVDKTRFPNGLREVSEHAAAKGVKTIVWFEPERVSANSWITNNHPDWVLGGAGGGLLNLGNPDAWKWLVNHINKMITDEKIGLYRQDFNMNPLDYWRNNDAPDRQGITENKHIVGYLAYWDALLKSHPGMLIDSCASGGMRNDLETMRRSIPLWRTDYCFEPNSGQCHSYGINLWIPVSGAGVREMTDYNFRSNGVASFGFHDDMRVAGANFDNHRRLLNQWRQYSPYFLDDYYPLTPYSTGTDVWMAWQFNRPKTGEGVVQAFRRPDSIYESARLKLKGLDANAKYSVKNLDEDNALEMTGAELMEKGMPISMLQAPAAAVVMYKKL